MSMRATAVQKECDRGNKNVAGDSNFFSYCLSSRVLYRSLFSLRKNVLCVARTLKDRVDVPLAAIRQILRLALGSMLQSVKKYRTYKINLLLLFSFLFMYSSSENFPD